MKVHLGALLDLFKPGQRSAVAGWLAIGFPSGRLEAAHIERNGKRAKCHFYSATECSPENTTETLVALRKTAHTKQFRCTTLLAPHEYKLIHIEAPNVPPEELTEAVRWQIKDQVDFPVEDAVIDTIKIPRENANSTKPQMIYVAAARSDVISTRMKQFEAAKIDLSVIDIPEMAQRNLASLFEDENRGLALAMFDGSGGLLTLTYQGELYLFRRIDISTTQLQNAPEIRREQLFERVVLEIQRTLDSFDGQFNFITLSKIYVHCDEEPAGFIDYLQQNTYLPLSPLPLATALDLNGHTSPVDLLLIGAGLREEEPA